MENPTFRLEGVVKSRDEAQDFEGPLSLILMLLQKNKIEIRDISISEILDQYLAYLDEMQRMDLEIASEFVQMAAYLLYIKTKTLLAVEEEVTELEQLMSSLEKLRAKDFREAVKAVLPTLADYSAEGLLLWTRCPRRRGSTTTGTRARTCCARCIRCFRARTPSCPARRRCVRSRRSVSSTACGTRAVRYSAF